MKLTVITVSHNVSSLIKSAIRSVYDTYKDQSLQVIVVDNASVDDSVETVRKNFSKVEIIKSHENTGFSKGNNLARSITKGDIVLFLNPDTLVKKDTIDRCIEILKQKPEVGAVTCKVMLPDGRIDYSCHRGLPTPWNTFCYWTGLSRIFPKSPLFSGYKASYLNTDESHYIDCISGTFLMIKKSVLEKIDWWDEDYFWNGEDIEMCYRIKKAGFRIWYESSVDIIHFKGSSSGLWPTAAIKVSKEKMKTTAIHAAKAMRIFVNKHAAELGPLPLVLLIKLGILILEKYRIWKINLGLSYQ